MAITVAEARRRIVRSMRARTASDVGHLLCISLEKAAQLITPIRVGKRAERDIRAALERYRPMNPDLVNWWPHSEAGQKQRLRVCSALARKFAVRHRKHGRSR